MEDHSSQFDKIYLPPLLLADMFNHTLVVMDDVQPNDQYAFVNITSIPNPPPVVGKSDGEALTNKGKVQQEPTQLRVIVPPAPPTVAAVNPQPILSTPIETSDITWLGAFNRKVLIIVEDVHAVHLAENELVLLAKMMEAVKLSMADVAVVNTARYRLSLNQIMQKLPAEVVLFFGVEPFSMGMPMKFPHFQLQRWNDGIYLFSPSLFEINTPSALQVNQKKGLWKALLEIFAAK
jgi:hypothetical protein